MIPFRTPCYKNDFVCNLDRMDVRRVNGNLNLSRAIGDLKYKGNERLPPKDQIISAQPDITEIVLEPQDRFVVLACDGVWDVKTNQVPLSMTSVLLNVVLYL